MRVLYRSLTGREWRRNKDYILTDTQFKHVKEVKNMCDVLDYVEKRGEKQGEMKKAKETAINMKARGFSNEDISDLVGVDLEMVKKWFSDELATVS